MAKGIKNLIVIFTLFLSNCLWAQIPGEFSDRFKYNDNILVGAEQMGEYFSRLQGKTLAIVANQTSMVGKMHLVDHFVSLGFKIKCVMAPEHGFRGEADAGEKVENNIDEKSGLPVISLYGEHKKPTKADLEGVDIVIFDIQDIGARFYTYISTMHYVMEACAEQNIEMMVLDRPNPNGFYVDGPVLMKGFESFVGMHPVPIVHGMTIGEYARMINGEGWLKNGILCNLVVIPVKNYKHSDLYHLPVKPSPNIQTMNAVYLYPTLCLFEGTVVSVGRGTNKPFEIVGFPGFTEGNYSFIPESKPGAKKPLFMGQKCYGFDLTKEAEEFYSRRALNLSWLIAFYNNNKDKKNFFNDFFLKLAGTVELRYQIENGKTEGDMRHGWQPAINQFKKIRKKYLLYPDFE